MLTHAPITQWQRIGLIAAGAIALRFVLGLDPVWWLAWIAPAPLVLLACRGSPASARASVLVAALIGVSVNLPYFTKVMPLAPALLVVLMQALAWLLILMATRRVAMHGPWWCAVPAYPLLTTAFDTLSAALLPDGNWGSIGYTQAAFLPSLQFAALLGVPGLVFMLSLVASTLALAWRRPSALAATALCVIAMLAYGMTRLQAAPVAAQRIAVGKVSIDDFLGPHTPPALTDALWHQYDAHIAALARQGARIIVLPEKIAVLAPAPSSVWHRHLQQMASQFNVTLVAGMGIDDGASRVNLAWLLPPGGPAITYQKHHLAPPERDFVPGHGYTLYDSGGVRYALGVCKDLHFAAFGREYARRGAQVMLVPAWDFDDDANLASYITLTRGVEGGYAIVRASRNGLLTVTDAWGRVRARQSSAAMPGRALLAQVDIHQPIATLYARIGPLFGWLCVVLAALLLAYSMVKPRMSTAAT